MKYPFFSFINKLTDTRLNSFGTIIEPINKIDGLREKIEMVVLMEYFPIQIKPDKQWNCMFIEGELCWFAPDQAYFWTNEWNWLLLWEEGSPCSEQVHYEFDETE